MSISKPGQDYDALSHVLQIRRKKAFLSHLVCTAEPGPVQILLLAGLARTGCALGRLRGLAEPALRALQRQDPSGSHHGTGHRRQFQRPGTASSTELVITVGTPPRPRTPQAAPLAHPAPRYHQHSRRRARAPG